MGLGQKELQVSTFDTEDEQVERIKKWIKQYGLVIILAVVVGLGGGMGWRYWKKMQVVHALQASQYYEMMLTQYSTGHSQQAQQAARKLQKDHSSSPYAALAGLFMAKQAVEQQHYQVAVKSLQWVIKNSEVPALKQVARNRAARILIAEKQPKQALQLLNKVSDRAYKAAIDEIRGDAYVALNETSQARDAYQLALQEAPKDAANRPILEMKFHQLAPVSVNNVLNTRTHA